MTQKSSKYWRMRALVNQIYRTNYGDYSCMKLAHYQQYRKITEKTDKLGWLNESDCKLIAIFNSWFMLIKQFFVKNPTKNISNIIFLANFYLVLNLIINWNSKKYWLLSSAWKIIDLNDDDGKRMKWNWRKSNLQLRILWGFIFGWKK